MHTPTFVLLTIVAESAIEQPVLKELAMGGVTQFTATDVTSARRRERPGGPLGVGSELAHRRHLRGTTGSAIV